MLILGEVRADRNLPKFTKGQFLYSVCCEEK